MGLDEHWKKIGTRGKSLIAILSLEMNSDETNILFISSLNILIQLFKDKWMHWREAKGKYLRECKTFGLLFCISKEDH